MRLTITRVLPWLIIAPLALWTAVRLSSWDDWYPAVQLMAFTPYVALCSLIPLLVTIVLRRWSAAVVAALTAVALFACVLPRWSADSDPLAGAGGPALRVLTANVLGGGAAAADLVTLARDQHVDVLALQELTPEFVAAADAAGLAQLLPYRVNYAGPGVGGSGLFSRHPLRDDGLRMNPWGFGQARGELSVPGARPVLIESVHPVAPYARHAVPQWRSSYSNEPRATPDGPQRILIGDFNATLDHSPLRKLIDSGYRDAADVLGEGLTGTWGPYDGDPIPPVVLDRVLADRRIGIRHYQVFDLRGSDHRPVLAELVLP